MGDDEELKVEDIKKNSLFGMFKDEINQLRKENRDMEERYKIRDNIAKSQGAPILASRPFTGGYAGGGSIYGKTKIKERLAEAVPTLSGALGTIRAR